MPYYNDERQRKVRVGIDSYTNRELVLDVIGYSNIEGKLGIGSIPSVFSPELYVNGDGYFSGVVTATTFFAGPTEITGGAFADELTVNTILVTGVSTFTGLSTFISDVYVGGTLYLDTIANYVLENIDLDGIFTANQLSTGSSETGINIYQDLITGPEVITIDPTTIGDNTGAVVIKGDLYIEGEQFYVNSTTIELADFNVGIATTVGTNVLLDGAGIGIGSTNIRKTLTYDYSSDSLKSSENFDLNSGKVYKIDEVEVLSSSQLTVPNIYSSGIGTIETLDATTGTIDNLDLDTLRVSGISTFTNGPVFVGSGTSTGTIDQKLQVTGGAYVSGNLGIGTTNPQTKLEINGTLGFTTYFRYNATRTNILIGDKTTGALVGSNINANDNIYMGIGAGSSATGGYNNFFGRNAGGAGGGGAFNNFIGYYAGYQNDYGASNNVFIGSGAGGYGPNQGSRNNFIGFYAGSNNTTGSYNNFFGSGGLSNTTGNYNTFFGAYSASNNTTGSYNNSFGQRAGKNNTTGSHNIYVGGFSGISTSASRKVIIGSGVNYSTLFDAPDTTKDIQFAVGIRTSSAPSKYWLVGDENFNVGIGTTNPKVRLQINGVLGFGTFTDAGQTRTNIRIGDETTGAKLTTGYDNIFMGVGAGNTITTSRNNIYIGKNAGRGGASPLGGNVFIGNDAGASESGNAYYNTFIGNLAGQNALFQSLSIFLGYQAGLNANNSQQNIFIGSYAGKDAIYGFRNYGFGNGALSNINGGEENIALGAYSGNGTSTGNYNNFFGQFAGYRNTTGSYNTLFGSNAGYLNTVGNRNAFFGNYAGFENTEGNDNIFIGSYAGISTSASRKVILGSGFNFSNPFDAPNTTKDTQLAIGIRTDANPSKYWLVGDENFNVGIGTTNPQTKLEVGGIIGFSDTNVRLGDSTTGANLTTNIATYEGVFNNFIGVNAGNSVTNGYYNNFFGYHAGAQNNGYYNNFFGRYAGANALSGASNLFIGDQAGRYSGDIYNNIFIGSYAGYESDNGNENIFIGKNAGYSNKSQSNTFIGIDAGEDNTTGQVNNFFGTGSGGKNTTGSYNLFLGYVAGGYNITGSNNAFFGNRAGKGNISGSTNIFFGHYTGISTAASRKVIIGSGFGTGWPFDAPDTTKNTQFAVGIRTDANPSKYWLVGDENFNIGIGTTNPKVRLQINGVLGFGTFKTSPFPFEPPRTNIRIGDETTGANLTSGYDNIFIGGAAAGNKTTTGFRNIFIGPESGFGNTSGRSNVFIGYLAGSSNTTGDSNLFVGNSAGYASTTGNNNTFFGSYSGYYHYEGDDNSFFGTFAGYNANGGSYNNFFGRNAGRYNQGNYNNFFGSLAGWVNSFGSYNNSFGAGSASYNTTGTYNNFFGVYSGFRNTTGSNNIFFGSWTGSSTTASNKIIFGRGFNFNNLFDSPDTTKDTQLAIGIRTDANPSKYWLVGDENFNVGIGTTNPTSKLTVGGDVNITGVVTAKEFIGIGSQISNITFRQLSDVDGSNLVPVGAGTTTPDYLVIYDPNTDSFRFVDPKTYFGINNDFNPDPIIVDYGSY